MNSIPFPSVNSSSAPNPTSFWHPSIKVPYPTNAPWMNLVLNNGSNPYLVTPYLIKSEPNKFSFGFPNTTSQSAFIFQVFVTDFILQIREGLGSHQVIEYDDLSVTLTWNSRLRVPLIPGSPYITFIFNNSTPSFSSIHAILSFSSNQDFTKHSVTFNNGQKWIIYCSSPLQFRGDMSATSAYSGIIRVALVPVTETSSQSAESMLDLYRFVYPVGGFADVANFEIAYTWRTETWKNRSDHVHPLIMLSMPVHRKCSFSSKSQHLNIPIQDKENVGLCYPTLDGLGIAQLGDTWDLKLPTVNITWHSSKSILDPNEREDLSAAVKNDVASMTPITTPSTYFNGKAMARIARLGLIAEEMNLTNETNAVKTFLKDALCAWYDGKFPGNSLIYDARWGGVISGEGAKDQGADFGLALYNDHHFHFGYFVYASAVLAKLDSDWGRKYKAQIDFLVNDYMNADKNSYFPKYRNFDFYALHSWAAGLYEFADGRNQESTSEAVNAYYAAALLGLASGNLTRATSAATLMSFEIVSSRALWHVWDNEVWNDSSVYDDVFLKENAVVGVVWSTKRDANLWFASSQCRTMRLGIQVLPITPITEALFKNVAFAKMLEAWATASPTDTTEAWDGFVLAIRAVWDRSGAAEAVKSLKAFDDGNSMSNLLWWVYSR